MAHRKVRIVTTGGEFIRDDIPEDVAAGAMEMAELGQPVVITWSGGAIQLQQPFSIEFAE